jgi:SNF2 family DNA or RNA helicase
MHELVLKEVAQKGVNKSQIAILKALLRLRQVCCDPRICKIPAAENVEERMLQLQEKKRLLAEGIYDEGPDAECGLTFHRARPEVFAGTS